MNKYKKIQKNKITKNANHKIRDVGMVSIKTTAA